MLTGSEFFYSLLIAYCLTYYVAAGLAINVAYHRCLSHRSFDLWRPLKYLLVTLGLPAGTPIQWAGNHRFHHKHADRPGDPHSPVLDGFWYAHVGWYIGTKNVFACVLYSLAGPFRTLYDGWNRPRTNLCYNSLAADLESDRYFRFVSRPMPFMILCWVHAATFFGLAYFVWGWIGVAFLWVTLVVIYNLGDAIDSVAHLLGERPFDAVHHARNNFWLGLLTLGEGWHANHHVFPWSAKHGLLGRQFDTSWQIIRILGRFGVAKNIKVPTRESITARMQELEK